jgi:hypothetical protein
MLFIDVNLGQEKGMQRLILYEEDDPIHIAQKFAEHHGISQSKLLKLERLLTIKMEEYRNKLRLDDSKVA